MTSEQKHRLAILGGNGFVGSWLTRHLANQFNVTVFDIAGTASSAGHFRACDVRDRRSLLESLQGFDLVINSAIIQVPEISEKKRLGYEVNVLGVQNICEAVESIDSIKGMLHAGSWHVFGERGLRGILTEHFGFRPDNIEPRARLYALCKIAQEAVIRITSEMSSKSYGIIRLGTVLGEGMPKLTAANIFIENALRGEPLTPYRHTQHRPMLYVDIQDVCKAFEHLAAKIMNGEIAKEGSAEIVNLVSPHPVTIVELARIVRAKVIKLTRGRIKPRIKIVDKGIAPIYRASDSRIFRADVSKACSLLGTRRLTNPPDSVEHILRGRMHLEHNVDHRSAHS